MLHLLGCHYVQEIVGAVSIVEPMLTWLDLTATDRDEMRRVLALFKEGTVDELGLGTLRDAFASVLFPGVTSIQTRLRYVLFVPWIYRRLEDNGTSSDKVATKARKAEVALIDALAESDDWGVIGIQARNDLQRLPSSVYWRCCVTWGIFMHGKGQSWYHNHFDGLRDAARSVSRSDDPGVAYGGQPNWHPRLPRPPDHFPEGMEFALSSEEADFVRGRIDERCAGSMLSWLAAHPKAERPDSLWNDPDAMRAGGDLAHTVELARRFSLHVEGLPLLYNLMLAEKKHSVFNDDDDDTESWVEGYTKEWNDWTQRESQETPFDSGVLWDWLAKRNFYPSPTQRLLVNRWTRRVAERELPTAKHDRELRQLIEKCERKLKGSRARLANPKRLMRWKGRSGVGRMHFNWPVASQMLIDLHQGLT